MVFAFGFLCGDFSEAVGLLLRRRRDINQFASSAMRRYYRNQNTHVAGIAKRKK
jgi:hypothetical protein